MQNIEKAVNEYVDEAINHGNATLEGDHKLANKSYDKIIENLTVFRRNGDFGDKELLKLLVHENDSVRLWAATHSLKSNERKAKSCLKKLVKSEGVLGFNAEIVLNEWSAGRLDVL